MKNGAEQEGGFSAYTIDKAQQLDRVDRRFKRMQREFNKRGQAYSTTHLDSEGDCHEVRVDGNFLFLMSRFRKTLKKDMEDIGEGGLAKEILQGNERSVDIFIAGDNK